VDLLGKTALVTGAARRVGRAIALELGRAGARVVVHHRDSANEAAEVAQSLKDPVVVQSDLTIPGAPEALVKAALEATGRLDVLVCSAAGYTRTPLAGERYADDLNRLLTLNVTAPALLARAAASAHVRAIVNIVDVAAWQPWPFWSAYATSKAALLHLTRCLALELAPEVRVNAVAPGTALFPDDWTPERRAAREEKIPLGRSGTPEDIARAVRFLLEQDYITGACLPVDGGAGLR
jgi:pteridine reductase